MDLLRIEVTERAGWQRLRLDGQLDVATAPQARQAFQEAQYGGGRRLVLDLAGLEFLDSFGLGVLVGALRRARLHDGELVLAAVPPRIAQVLEVVGLDATFPTVGHVDELAAPDAPGSRADGQ